MGESYQLREASSCFSGWRPESTFGWRNTEGSRLYLRKTMPKAAARPFLSLALLLSVSAAALAKSAPDPGFKSLDGHTRKLSSLRGQVVVVNFWATWCGPCQEEMPRLAKLAANYSGKNVRFVLISID